MQHLSAKLAGRQYIGLSDSKVLFNSHDSLPILVINAPFCQATIALQGAQLLTFQPTGDTPWLWLSPQAIFETGKSVRGGIPVCLPWFGVNRQQPEKPKHGFVRNQEWLLESVAESAEAITLQFRFDYAGDQPELFASAFSAILVIELARAINIRLQLHNTSELPAEFSWALHSYFAVEDCRLIQVSGLEQQLYLDNTQGLQAFVQVDTVEFQQEVDRVYTATSSPQTITGTHPLQISGEHCPTCIVWNPGAAVAATQSDIGEYYTQYICVERGCAFADTLQLAGGEVFNSRMQITRP